MSFECNEQMNPEFGFVLGDSGPHSSRTMMLPDLQEVLAYCSDDATLDEYMDAIINQNILARKTASTRRRTAHILERLYGLDPEVTVFRVMRQLWSEDEDSQRLLALLCASARDPLLRFSAPAILDVDVGELVKKEDVVSGIREATDDAFADSTLEAIVQRIRGSWTQSGHLQGKVRKVRQSPPLTPTATCYALLLSYLCGRRGQFLFLSFWCRLLDAREDVLYESVRQASQRGLMVFKNIGDVVEVGFPRLLLPEEKDMINGQD